MGRRRVVKRFLTEANLFLNYSALNNFMAIVLICFYPSQICVFYRNLEKKKLLGSVPLSGDKTRPKIVTLFSMPELVKNFLVYYETFGFISIFMTARYSTVLTDSDESNPRSHTTSFGEADNAVLKRFSPSVSGTLRLWFRIQL